jgi:SAM-dependent methyltransferase
MPQDASTDLLLPDRLKRLWGEVEGHTLTAEAFQAEQDRLLAGYRDTWFRALLRDGFRDIEESSLAELSEYLGVADRQEVRRRCEGAVGAIKEAWERGVDAGRAASVEAFYDANQDMLYELTWWHTLRDDPSPMAYVMALEFARQRGCRRVLDFGSGVGSGGILFARSGLEVALADISGALLGFSRWRMEQRGLPARTFDLKHETLPVEAFDLVTAMDVFEHLPDPVATVTGLARTLRPGGFLFGRFHAEEDEDRPLHVVADFGPTFDRLKELGFAEVWRDQWLWGEQAFRKGGP